MSMPSVFCQGTPDFIRACSQPIRRVSSRISPKAMPVVGLPWLVVPQTTMPRSAQAFMSIEAL